MAAAAVKPDLNLSVHSSINSLSNQEQLEAAMIDLIQQAGINRGWCRGEPITKAGKRRQVMRMLTLILIPIVTLLCVSSYFLADGISERQDTQKTEDVMSFTVELGQLIHKLQEERDQSVLYLSSIGPDTKSYLLKRYLETDAVLEALSSWPVNLDTNKSEQYATKKAFQLYITQHRNELSLIRLSVFDELRFYTDCLTVMMSWLYNALAETKYSTTWKGIVAYQKIVFCKEDAGIERALGSFFFSNGGFTDRSTYDWINKQINVFRHNFEVAQNYSPLVKPISYYDIVMHEKNLSEIIFEYRDQIQNRNISKKSVTEATMWFDNMTLYLDQLLEIQRAIADDIFQKLKEKQNRTLIKISMTVVVMVSVLIMCPVLITSIIRLTSDIQSYVITLADKTKELNMEKCRTDSLLYQMVPKPVAEQLKRNKGVTAEYFKEVTIFFSDIVGFTRFTSEMAPMQVVRVLDEIFMAFDEQLEQHDVYKVETIGDSYMVASGLPRRNGNRHAQEIANLSLDLLHCCASLDLTDIPRGTVSLRIGLHTANRIHVSQSTYRLVAKTGLFKLQRRGPLQIKGKGQMITYWLCGHQDNALGMSAEHGASTSTCVQNFHPPDEDLQDEFIQDIKSMKQSIPRQRNIKSTVSSDTGISIQKASKEGSWMESELPSYDELERRFETVGSPPIVQLTEGFHY